MAAPAFGVMALSLADPGAELGEEDAWVSRARSFSGLCSPEPAFVDLHVQHAQAAVSAAVGGADGVDALGAALSTCAAGCGSCVQLGVVAVTHVGCGHGCWQRHAVSSLGIRVYDKVHYL